MHSCFGFQIFLSFRSRAKESRDFLARQLCDGVDVKSTWFPRVVVVVVFVVVVVVVIVVVVSDITSAVPIPIHTFLVLDSRRKFVQVAL